MEPIFMSDSMSGTDLRMSVFKDDVNQILTISVSVEDASANVTIKGWCEGFEHPSSKAFFHQVSMACRRLPIPDMTQAEFDVDRWAAYSLLRTLEKFHTAQTNYEPITYISDHQDDQSNIIIGTDSLAQCSAFGSEDPGMDHLFSTYTADSLWMMQHMRPKYLRLQSQGGVMARSSRHPDHVLHLRVDGEDRKSAWTARFHSPTSMKEWPLVTTMTDVDDAMPDNMCTALQEEIESNPGECEYLFESKENWEDFKASTLPELFEMGKKALELSQLRKAEMGNISEI